MEKLKSNSLADANKAWQAYDLFLRTPTMEIWDGFKERSIPGVHLFLFGALTSFAYELGAFGRALDRYHLKFQPNHYLSGSFGLALVFSGFYGWAWRQGALRRTLQKKLASTFTEAGLRTKLEEIPQFVSDRPMGSSSRKLRIRAKGLPLSKFKAASEYIDSGLNIRISKIDNPDGNQEFVDIVYTYSSAKALESWHMEEMYKYRNFEFPIGRSIDGEITASLRKIPHFLVAGETGSGKSTFINAMIMVLTLNNRDLKVLYIDMKSGMENQLFEGADQVERLNDIASAEAALADLNNLLDTRMKMAANAGAKNIDVFNAKQEDSSSQWHRILVVVDEVAELVPTVNHPEKGKLAKIQSVLNRLTRLGRAVGMHIVVGVQKPDHKNLDPTIKANLPGVMCFAVSHFSQSTVILGNSHAADLNAEIPGRGIWKHGAMEIEVQAPFLTAEDMEQARKRKDQYFKKPEVVQTEVSLGKENNSQVANAFTP